MQANWKTAESVAIGHPDKVCDQISDMILDECLKQDPNTRAAIETMGGHGVINVCGELTTEAYVNAQDIVRDVYEKAGYDPNTIGILVNIVQQSPEIAGGVDVGGAGDQGIMIGYACNETPEFMPKEVMLARKLTMAIGQHDGKSQVTLDEEGNIKAIITSICAQAGVDYDYILNRVTGELFEDIEAGELNKIWLQNPNGEWEIGGFEADTGLTGRKLAVDNYGPNIPLGGGAFSGKDATKVDRSAAYMARKIAVDYVNMGADEAFVKLAYAIGKAEPVMAVVAITDKTGTTYEQIKGYDLTPAGIIDRLKLREPQFYETAKYGHFGRGFTWDKPTS